MKLAVFSALAALTGTAALAGGYAAPVVEAAPVAVVETAPADVGWTGFYGGLQYGRGSADLSFGSTSADLGDIYGLDLDADTVQLRASYRF